MQVRRIGLEDYFPKNATWPSCSTCKSSESSLFLGFSCTTNGCRKIEKIFFATLDDLALLTIRSAVLNQNGVRLIQSYGHFVTSSDKRKRKNEASDEFLGEAKTGLG